MFKQCLIVIGVAIAATGRTSAWPTATQADRAPTCRPSGALMRLAGLPEASGLVVSRATPGRLWALNDSGAPELFALDTKGQVTGRVPLAGAALNDWEALASARCGAGACLFVGDIGDNDASRPHVTVYRLPEPAAATGTARVQDIYQASYPDGAHDAEALLAASDGALYIVTKGDTGPIALYRFPADLRAGTTMRLERVGGPITKAQPADDARVTDGAISGDGAWVILRTRGRLTFYRAAEFLTGTFRESHSVDVSPLGEPQGEAVAFGASNTVYVAGEGGGKAQPGTFAMLSCTL